MSDFIESRQQAARAIEGMAASPPAELAPQEPGRSLGPVAHDRNGPVLVSYVADRNHIYGGESLTLYAQTEARAPVAGYTLRIRLPAGFEIEYYRELDSELLPTFEASRNPDVLVNPNTLAPILADPTRYVVWRVDEAQNPGDRRNFEIRVRINVALQGGVVRSQATVYAAPAEADVDTLEAVDNEAVEISVRSQAAYLKYLPALYAQDEFMGRFLMLFESFWQPIEQQIDHIHYFLDPQLTPARFLPWLASWFRLSMESEEWTEEKQRQLLSSIIWLYRKRGTKQALEEYLEILTGNPVEIVEHRAKDFRLGGSARLGVGIALGSGNVPYTFAVHVQLDPYTRPADVDEERWAEVKERRELERRQLIDQLIAHEKPAHTQYTVEFEVKESE